MLVPCFFFGFFFFLFPVQTLLMNFIRRRRRDGRMGSDSMNFPSPSAILTTAGGKGRVDGGRGLRGGGDGRTDGRREGGKNKNLRERLRAQTFRFATQRASGAIYYLSILGTEIRRGRDHKSPGNMAATMDKSG